MIKPKNNINTLENLKVKVFLFNKNYAYDDYFLKLLEELNF